MKILLLGAHGQVGWELARSLQPIGEVVACARQEANLEDLDDLKKLIRFQNPQIIVNAAAYTAVDKAETEPDLAYRINSEAVEVMAQEAKNLDSLLVHYSTDYVFDGRKSAAFSESDAPNPLNIYGKSKLQGELAIQDSNCRHLIFRTSWVYAARGHNFIKTILRLAQEKEDLKIVADQVGAPTGAELIADVTAVTLQRITHSKLTENYTGLYHLTASGQTSWYHFAKTIISEAHKQGLQTKVSESTILPIETKDYPLPAQRPFNSLLDTAKISALYNIDLPSWEIGVKRAIKEIMKSD